MGLFNFFKAASKAMKKAENNMREKLKPKFYKKMEAVSQKGRKKLSDKRPNFLKKGEKKYNNFKKNLKNKLSPIERAKQKSKIETAVEKGALKNYSRKKRQTILREKATEYLSIGTRLNKKSLIKRMVYKASLITDMVDGENDMLRNRSSFIRTSRFSDDKYMVEEWLKTNSRKDLLIMEKTIDAQLAGMGLKSEKEITRAILDEEYRYNSVVILSREDFMNNWINKFSSYTEEDDGITDDERETIIQGIRENYTLEKFIARHDIEY